MRKAAGGEQARMSIGAVERMIGINANTLRMWERRYQLGASSRSSGGQREYSATDVDQLRLIKKLTEKGMRIGDIAQLPTDALTNLLIETGGHLEELENTSELIDTQVVGIQLSHYFKAHIKRYPNLAITFSETDGEKWLSETISLTQGFESKKLLIIQQGALNKKHLAPLSELLSRKIQIIVLYLYSHQEVLTSLEKNGAILLAGPLEALKVDKAVQKAQRLTTNLSALDQHAKEFDLALPVSRPRQFSDEALIEAEKMANKLNCECPPHLTDLVRRLAAFEDYSQSCGADNWRQSAVHACVYTYTNQARYLIEKALRAVLDE